jgi:Na+/H+-dicarboxylate symporter
LPLIISAMILAMQRIKEMAEGGPKLAYYSIGYFVMTTLIAIIHSTILVALVWRNRFQEVSGDSLQVDEDDQAQIEENSEYEPADVVQELFDSIIPGNLVQALADNVLLSILVTSVVIGCLLKRDSRIVNAVREIEELITRVISFLIKIAPIGVFFLILSNLMRLEISEIGINLGFLIGSALTGMFIQLLIVYPTIWFIIMRTNPYSYWIKGSPAWVTAWGSASSAATLPVTMRCLRARKWPETVIKFAAPLGCLVNMDG